MKKLTGLLERVKHFEESAPKEVHDGMPTFRQLLLNVLGGTKAATGEQALDMFKVGMAVRDAKDGAVDVEDADFKLLEEKVRENSLGWSAHYLAQVILKLKAAGGQP